MSEWTPLAAGNGESAAQREEREERHRALIDLLGAYADRELPPETTSQIEAHLVGCARCRRELAVHQEMSRRLAVQPPVAAPPELRERIVASLAVLRLHEAVAVPAPRRVLWLSPKLAAIVAGLVLVAAVLTATVLTSRDEPRSSPAIRQVSVAPSSVPLLTSVLRDYRRVTAGDLPGRARDLEVVRGAMPFPVEPLRAQGVRLLAAWTTELDGEPAAVLAYRWGDRMVLEYIVSEERFFQHPAVRDAVRGGGILAATDGEQGIVAWPADAAGVLLLGDVAPERLATLPVPEPLARTGRGGTQ